MIEIYLKKRFSSKRPFEIDVQFSFEPGKFVTLYGPSGSGKTSILRMIAGFLSPDQGYIRIDGEFWYDQSKRYSRKTRKRDIGFVFQENSLFPHMTVKENLLFGGTKDRQNKIKELVDIFDLTPFLEQRPGSLSGGQKQRAEIARALMRNPRYLLLDEPFTALDMTLRHQALDYLQSLKKNGLTIIHVSHDISEVVRIADELILLFEGKVLRHSRDPANLFQGEMSGKFQLAGQVIRVEKQDILYVATILIEKQLVRVVVDRDTAGALEAGETVLVSSKAFNPVIRKFSQLGDERRE